MACGIYVQFGINLFNGDVPKVAYEKMKDTVLKYYSKEPYIEELKHFSRILTSDISKLPVDSIKSSGYVVDSLEACLWCFLNNDSYKDTVITAVNLGGDTDTIGALAGGLAGIYYGYEGIPKEWIEKIVKVDEIIRLGERLYKAIYGIS